MALGLTQFVLNYSVAPVFFSLLDCLPKSLLHLGVWTLLRGCCFGKVQKPSIYICLSRCLSL